MAAITPPSSPLGAALAGAQLCAAARGHRVSRQGRPTTEASMSPRREACPGWPEGKDRDKALLGGATPKPPALPELQGLLLLGEPALEKTCSRKLLLGPPIEMAVPPDARDDLLYHPAWKHSHTAVPKQDSDRCACALLPSQHLSGAKSPVNWVIPVSKKRASVT